MDKPEWCPQDVWDYVLDEVGPIGVHVYRISYKMVCERIARAILSAQSQAYTDAARIAAEYGDKFPGDAEAPNEISAAILQRKEEIGRN